MYYAPDEYNPPHFHAYYQDKRAIVDLLNCDVTISDFPKKQIKMIEAWAELHQDELLANWNLCMNGETPFQIAPLR